MRVFKAAAAVTAAGLVLAACGSDDGGDGGSGSADEPVELTFQTLAWQTASIKANEQIVKTWNEENPDIQVELLQGDWNNVHDQLVTSFEGGTAPDVFHYESTTLLDFSDRGNVLDLSEYLSDGIREDIRQGAWDTVTYDDGVYGVPFLQESQVVFANKAVVDKAGIELPTIEDPWTWDEFAAAAQKLTTENRYGAVFPLKSPANRVLNLGRNFGADYFSDPSGDAKAVFGDAEAEVPQRIHEMIYTDETASPDGVGMSSSDALPAFFDGQYALLPGAIWLRQQLTEQAPDGFEWITLPALEGDSQQQGAVAQTLSVSASTEHPEEAVQFIEYFLNAENQVKLAAGDWLLPTSQEAAKSPRLNDEATGWDVATATADNLEMAPFQQVKGFEEWKSKIANPALQEYFSDEISIEELGTKLTEDGNEILERYQR
ncbi:carbohydrate ABC transporter substrate-binding protein (CUT1 family) [Haloactinopolyspora alba]|uniref:Carbohydrate ABC transporter substrate-binding protein (CUT1 family) n=1 Tax=Haloactinopolyspora alba TaxID=648780 RepID=A0A2P8E9L7_9ACTN|nr:sugar ABC transporter substrate-binding protein [Haloactinopolyspora alba]PSL06144.1 carbohydrate ABC transporter substrate-binding protein (CUT1 family) [Haloactinopolyspora alba]